LFCPSDPNCHLEKLSSDFASMIIDLNPPVEKKEAEEGEEEVEEEEVEEEDEVEEGGKEE
jgi:hypothetical protein